MLYQLEHILYLFALPAVCVFFYMIVFWAIGGMVKNNGVIDIAWGLGFCFIALGFAPIPHQSDRQILMMIMVFVWAIRLSGYLLIRNWGKPEDYRYANWRKEWGKNIIWRSFLQIYMLQGFFMVILSLPILITMDNNKWPHKPLGTIEYIGAGLFTIGWLFETIGDLQNYLFKRNPKNKGKVMKYGLWRYTRHPNYFGESLVWFGIATVAAGAPYGYWGYLSPVILTLLLLFVSGIPLLEKRYEGNKEYQEYKRKTSAFVPWPPKKS